VRTSEQLFLHSQFVWDSCFSVLGYAYGWRQFPVTASLDCLYATQEDGGYIDRCHDVRDGTALVYEPGFGPNPPLFAAAELALMNLTGNADRVAAVYPVLRDHFGWIEANRRLPSGLYWTTGLANGRDNAPCEGAESLDMTAQMAQFARECAELAGLLGRRDEAAAWLRKKEEIAAALNAILWSDELGCYAYSLVDGRPNPHKVVTTFWPLWADAVPAERLPALVRMARNPATFNRHHPFPTLSADSPRFHPEGDYWQGSTWAPTNYAALKGFWRAGERELAREFACRHLRCMTETFDATDGVLWENYCSEKSERGNHSCRNYSWTAGNAISVLLELVIGLEPDALHHRLGWAPPSRRPRGGAALSPGRRDAGPAPDSLGGRRYHRGDVGSTGDVAPPAQRRLA
jgi:glycogen debranching enzyme